MRKILKKLKRNKTGFSLAETLIAILILLMVSAIVAGAIPVAGNVYAKTVDAANAQVLLSTTMTVLRDELGTVSVPTNVTISLSNFIYQGKYGWSKLEFGTFQTSGDAVVTEGEGAEEQQTITGIRTVYHGTATYNEGSKTYTYGFDDTNPNNRRFLVSPSAITKNLKIECESVTYSNGVFTFTNLQITKGEGADKVVLAERASFKVRTVS